MSNGCISIPGFVDLQVNGLLGVDFSSPNLTEEQILSATQALMERGTAAFLATMVTCDLPIYRRNLALLAKAQQRNDLKGRLLGIHIEGPFISSEQGYVGAHDPQHVVPPDAGLLNQMQDWAEGHISLLTIAAELPGAEDLVGCAREIGMAVSIGHSNCLAADLARVTDAGASAVTHLGNGIPAQIARHANPLWPALANDRLTAMLITDGHHLPDDFIRVVLRAKGVERVVVVSDLSPIAGLPPGEYTCFGNQVVMEESGRIGLAGTGLLAASGQWMMQGMNHLASLRSLSEVNLLAVGFHNPLKLINVEPNAIQTGPGVAFDAETSQFALCV